MDQQSFMSMREQTRPQHSVVFCLSLKCTMWPPEHLRRRREWAVSLNLRLLQVSSSVWIWTSSPSSSTCCPRAMRKRRIKRGGRPSSCAVCGRWLPWLKFQRAVASCWSSSPCWWRGATQQRRTRTSGAPLRRRSESSAGPRDHLWPLETCRASFSWGDNKNTYWLCLLLPINSIFLLKAFMLPSG